MVNRVTSDVFDHAQESPKFMTLPLDHSGNRCLFAGFLNLPAIFGGHQRVSHWLAPSLVEHHPHAGLVR